ncbi:MAG: translesion error-prone DNA polymerase V autoproteolytic subunit [Bacteroidales bacterium]|nr:translesion error-prone DNA polymerase V autoproteolytic subunit [Bacteroidales bacterium]
MKKTSAIQLFTVDTTTVQALPLAESGISAGFPSPAQDYIDLSLDLNKELISNPSSTFFGRVRGTSMKDAGILDGDILVIDKSLEPQDGDTAVCFIDGEFTLKHIRMEKEAIYLIPANPDFKTIRVTESNNFCIWGIVTYSIKDHKNRHRK